MLLPSGLERRFSEDGHEVTRISWNGSSDTTEATALQAAGADGGRAGDVITLTLVSPGVTGQAFRAFGPATHAVIQGSLTSGTGPWTNLLTTALAAPVAEGDEITLYLRILVLRGFGSTSPRHTWAIRLSGRTAADWGR